MQASRIRNFEKISRRLQTSLDHQVVLSSHGSIEAADTKYPLYKIQIGRGNPRRVLISAGIHGDEPAGVETLLDFMENQLYLRHVTEWELTLLPCLNPFGYEYGTRENHKNQDLNRLFKSKTPPDDILLIQSVFDQPFDLTLELHEDLDSHGYYLYQSAGDKNNRHLGYRIIDAVKSILPINGNDKIEGAVAKNGVIERLPDAKTMNWWPMALYALSKGAGHCLTLETPASFTMEKRIEAHVKAIETALRYYRAREG